MIEMKKVVEKAHELEMNLEKVKTELKRIQSVKCRLKKQKAKPTYEAEMREVVAEEQLLKEVRDYILPKKPTTTTLTQEQIDNLTYDETIKAIKSIQSKKSNTRYLTENIEENVEYQEACRIEKMLLEHKAKVKPLEDNVVAKSAIETLIADIENANKIDKEDLLEKLRGLLG